ncbi:MAG: FecR domain-containing protein [Bacteroidota bacterium]
MKDQFKDDTFLARWLNNELSEKELAEFEAQEDFELYAKIAQTSATLHPPERNKEEGWEAIRRKAGIGAPTPVKEAKKRRIGAWWAAAAAASVLLLVAFWALWNRGGELEVVVTAVAAQEQLLLPDGSEVWLNADSRLTYDKTNFLQERHLDLSGEAFFKVKKGEAFVVKTAGGNIQVLGTSFNVKSRATKMDLACYTGKVGLSFGGLEDPELLLPGERLMADNQRIVQKRKFVAQSAEPSWTAGQSRFVQVRFAEVLEELQRQYDIDIDYPAQLNSIRDYTGGFPHNNLNSALEIVFSSIEYNYQLEGRTVRVFR